MDTYLAINSPRRAPSTGEVDGHLAFLADLDRSGVLLASGPFLGGGGAYLFRADSLAAAEDLVDTDPFKLAGQSDYQLHAWNVDISALGTSS